MPGRPAPSRPLSRRRWSARSSSSVHVGRILARILDGLCRGADVPSLAEAGADAGGLFLTAGADVQKDRIEVDVWAWGRGGTSWLVDHIVIDGGPDHQGAWAELTKLLDRTWTHQNGAHLQLAKLAIDTGYEAPAVYAWSRRQGVAQVAPVKGVEGFNRSSPVSGPTYVDVTDAGKRLRRGARLWTVAVSTFKAETYRHLGLPRPTKEELAEGVQCPPGTVHLPDWVDSEWLKQLVAEELVTVRTKRGFAGQPEHGVAPDRRVGGGAWRQAL